MSRSECLSATQPSPQSVGSWSASLPSVRDSLTTPDFTTSPDSVSTWSDQSMPCPSSLLLIGALYHKGQKVLVRLAYDGFYYPGVVEETSSYAYRIPVSLVDQTILRARCKDVIQINGAEPFPSLHLGDPVLVRVRSLWGPHCYNGACDFYIPGRVCSLPDRIKPIAVAYSVLAYNGVVVTCPRRYIVRIGVSVHLETCQHIAAISALLALPIESEQSVSFLSDLVATSQQKFLGDSQAKIEASSASMHQILKGENTIKFSRKETRTFNSCKDRTRHLSSEEHKIEQLMDDWREKLHEKEEKSKRIIQLIAPPSFAQGLVAPPSFAQGLVAPPSFALGFGSFKSYQLQKDGNNMPHMKDIVQNKSCDDTKPINKSILVQCSGSGWYYRAIAKRSIGELWYEVTHPESNKALEHLGTYKVHKNDIVFISSKENKEIKQGQTVLSALYPRQECFAPGKVAGMSRDKVFYYIQFHDQMKLPVPCIDVFPLEPARYILDVETIKLKGASIITRTVIAKRNEDGLFPQGKLIEQIAEGSMYKIEWENGECQGQHSMHIFGDMTKNRNLHKGDFILAPRPDQRVYIPAVVKYKVKDNLWVRGYDKHSHWVNLKYQRCFWLSSEYFHDAVDYISVRAKLAVTSSQKQQNNH